MTRMATLTSPQHNYQHAQRVAVRFAQIFGAEALERMAIRRAAFGWWSPLFPVEVLALPKKPIQ